MTSLIYALDFDGVICDSARETSITALLSAKAKWPHLDLPSSPHADIPESLINSLRRVRPVIETGFENVLLGRLVAETPANDLVDGFEKPVLKNWADMREELMEKWDLDKDDLVQLFGKVRDSWIENDIDSWIEANRPYPDVVDALNRSSMPVYIITTKQKRFASLLLNRFGVNNIPEENIFAFGMGSKISVLKKIIAMPQNAAKKVLFVEDRYETLEKVSLSMLGQPLELFLATWGYNTESTRSVADRHPFIELLELPQFVKTIL